MYPDIDNGVNLSINLEWFCNLIHCAKFPHFHISSGTHILICEPSLICVF